MPVVAVAFPRKNLDLLNWSENFNHLIGLTPEAFGLTSVQAAAYNVVHDLFAAKVALATNPATKTEVTVEEQRLAKENLKTMARNLAQEIQSKPATTDAQRIALRITVLSPATSIAIPGDAPSATITAVNGWRVSVRVRGVGTDSRGKPKGCAGVNVYVATTPEEPTSPNDFRFEGDSSKADFDVQLDESLPVGSKVWMSFCWKNPRFQTGPASVAIPVIVGGGKPQAVVE